MTEIPTPKIETVFTPNVLSGTVIGHAAISELFVVEPVAENKPTGIIDGLEGLESLKERQKALGDMWHAQDVVITNPFVEDATMTIVDAAELNTYKVFMKLNNWADVYGRRKETDAQVPYDWQMAKSQSVRDDINTSAVAVETPNATTFLINPRSFRVLDSLVEIRVDKAVATDHVAVAQAIDRALVEITGQGAFPVNGEQAAQSAREQAVRDYFKLPDGPLEEDMRRVAEAVKMTISENGLVHPSLEGAHIDLKVGYDDRGQAVPVHEVSMLQDIEEIIKAGGLLSALERLKRGHSPEKGKSTYSDFGTGGADSVFAYYRSKQDSTGYISKGFVGDEKLLDRLDVRAFDYDAHGSKAETFKTPIDTVLGRSLGVVKIHNIMLGHETRLRPSEFADGLQGSHEVCFEKGISLENIDKFFVDSRKEASSLHDFRWDDMLRPLIKEKYGDNAQAKELLFKILGLICDDWTINNKDGIINRLVNLGMPVKQAVTIVTGMELPPKERLIKRLNRYGIDQVNGKPLDEFIVDKAEIEQNK